MYQETTAKEWEAWSLVLAPVVANQAGHTQQCDICKALSFLLRPAQTVKHLPTS